MKEQLTQAVETVKTHSERVYQKKPVPDPPPDFKPLGTYIVVFPDTDIEVTSGGIIKPDIAKERPETGVVVKVGPDVVTLLPGDRIQHTRNAGKRIPLEGNDYLVMKEAEVYGVYGRGI